MSTRHRWKINIKIYPKGIVREDVEMIHLVQNRDQNCAPWGCLNKLETRKKRVTGRTQRLALYFIFWRS